MKIFSLNENEWETKDQRKINTLLRKLHAHQERCALHMQYVSGIFRVTVTAFVSTQEFNLTVDVFDKPDHMGSAKSVIKGRLDPKSMMEVISSTQANAEANYKKLEEWTL